MLKSRVTNNFSSVVSYTTNLPGVDNSHVIVSYPKLIKENSSKPTVKIK